MRAVTRLRRGGTMPDIAPRPTDDDPPGVDGPATHRQKQDGLVTALLRRGTA